MDHNHHGYPGTLCLMDPVRVHHDKLPCHQFVIFSFYRNRGCSIQHINQFNSGMPMGGAVPSLFRMISYIDPCLLQLKQWLINHFLQKCTS